MSMVLLSLRLPGFGHRATGCEAAISRLPARWRLCRAGSWSVDGGWPVLRRP